MIDCLNQMNQESFALLMIHYIWMASLLSGGHLHRLLVGHACPAYLRTHELLHDM